MAVTTTGTSPHTKTRPRRFGPSARAIIECAWSANRDLDTAVAGVRRLVRGFYQQNAFTVRSHFDRRRIEADLYQHRANGVRADQAEIDVGARRPHRIGVSDDEHFGDRALLDGTQNLR